jgi:TIR domain
LRRRRTPSRVVTKTRETLPNTGIRVFISHSSADVGIATALIELLRYAMPDLDPHTIRCSSVPGYKLSGGADTDDTLREEMRDAAVFVALLTDQSLKSTYVLFELGARWGAGSKFTPLVAAGLLPSELKAPLNGLHVQSCDSETDLHQMLTEIADLLSLKLVGPHLYASHLKRLVELSKTQSMRRLAGTTSEVASRPSGDTRPRIERLQPKWVTSTGINWMSGLSRPHMVGIWEW